MRHIKGSVFLFLAFTFAGTSVVSARFVSGRLGPFLITAMSLLLALAFLLPFCAGSLWELRRLPLKGWLSLALQALFGIVLFRLFLVWGLRWTDAGEAGILTGATPAVTALFAVVLLRERLSGGRLAGVLCTTAGILTLQGLLSGTLPTAAHLAGDLLVLCAAACEAAFNVMSRVFAVSAEQTPKPLTPKPLTPKAQTAAVTALALLFSLIPACFEQPFRRLSALGPPGWMALVWYGGVVTALGFVCWYAGIRRSGAFAAAAFSGMMPVTAMLLSAVLLGERPGIEQWAGGALVTAGMILTGAAEPKNAGPVRLLASNKKGAEH